MSGWEREELLHARNRPLREHNGVALSTDSHVRDCVCGRPDCPHTPDKGDQR